MRRSLTGIHSGTIEVPFLYRISARGLKVFRLCDEWREYKGEKLSGRHSGTIGVPFSVMSGGGYKGVTYRVYTRELKEFRLRDEGCTGEIECSRLQCL